MPFQTTIVFHAANLTAVVGLFSPSPLHLCQDEAGQLHRLLDGVHQLRARLDFLSAQPDHRDDGRGNHQNPRFPSVFHPLSIGETAANIKRPRNRASEIQLRTRVARSSAG